MRTTTEKETGRIAFEEMVETEIQKEEIRHQIDYINKIRMEVLAGKANDDELDEMIFNLESTYNIKVVADSNGTFIARSY